MIHPQPCLLPSIINKPKRQGLSPTVYLSAIQTVRGESDSKGGAPKA